MTLIRDINRSFLFCLVFSTFHSLFFAAPGLPSQGKFICLNLPHKCHVIFANKRRAKNFLLTIQF